jgi:lipopolysaccharide export LptBFGC system permease protein LptF
MTEMSLAELARRSNEYDAGGFPQAARKAARAYHIRFALPAATVVMSLLAVAICGTLRGRAGRIVAVFISLALYWAILAAGERNANLPAIGSVWAPNMVFTAISLALLKTLPRQPDRAK